jgi:riboflavin synthase
MFTGIIEELGTVRALEKGGVITRIRVLSPVIAGDTRLGQSVSVNGVCLTVVEKGKDLLSFEVMRETCKRTNLGALKPGEKVNLERALKADARLDGHFVTGHIDGTGRIAKRYKRDGDTVFEIEAGTEILRQMALKGSVALDGISLTVSGLKPGSFCVGLIPYTLQNTTLTLKRVGYKVNIECDILAKYAAGILSQGRSAASNLSLALLREHGFTPS